MQSHAVLRHSGVVVLVAVVAVVVATDATTFSAGHYASGITTANPSCGQCHAGNAAGVAMALVAPPSRSLALAQQVSLTAAVKGGAAIGGGFAVDAAAGTFVAGTGSTTTSGGLAITHDQPGSALTSWTFGYVAPAVPGLVEISGVALSTDGDGTVAGDLHAFSGFADGTTPALPTPVRVYANIAGVRAVGASCIGGYDNFPVLGSKDAPAVGNRTFTLELFGGATHSYAALILGASLRATPLDLGPWGIDGCKLYVNEAICRFVCTYGSDPRLADGAAVFELPIPAVAGLRGQAFAAQAAIIDLNARRPIALVLTNALEVTVQ